jgi:hypothetical protein
MGYNPNNVTVGLATAFIQPWSVSSPAVLPPDSLALNGDWTVSGTLPWEDLGATDQGWALNIQTKSNDIRIEEQDTPVDVVAESKMVTVTGTLAEDTLKHMMWAYGGGTITTVAAGPGVVGKKVLTLQTALSKWALGVETINLYGLPRRLLLPKCVISSSPQTKFRRAAEKRMYDFSAQTIIPVNEMVIVEITAPATS